MKNGFPNEDEYLIRCQNVGFINERGRRISGIDLEILKGEKVCILSSVLGLESDALHLLAGFIKPCHGIISFKEKNFKRDICFLPQDMVYPKNVMNVVIGKERCSVFDFSKKKAITSRALEALDTVGCSELAKMHFSELSLGQKKRVLFAKALFSFGDTVFLEYPTQGLDAVGAKNVNLNLKKLSKTVIFSSRDIREALEFADKILYLSDNMHFFGTPEELAILLC